MTPPAIPLGPFELHAPIGRGGMGEVWSGRHLAEGVEVAVKVLTSYLSWDESFREQFRNEVRAVAQLDHPAIVMVFDHGEVSAEAAAVSEGRLAEGAPYLVMEKLDGALSGSFRPTSWLAVRIVVEVILDALSHAHARGVIHRDIKLANVLVSRGPQPGLKLADFGIARALGASGPTAWESGTVAGTPQYMAPEQILGSWRDQGPWTDLYSLACVTWRLLTGSAPFGGRGVPSHEVMRGHLEDEPPPFRPRIPVPAGVEEWLRRALSKQPGDRYGLAADARHALRAIESAERVDWVLPETVDAGEEPSDLISATELPTLSVMATERAPPPEGAISAAPSGTLPFRPPMPQTWRESAPPRPPVALNGAGLGLYDLRPVPLVGRVTERDLLWGELRRVEASREPRVVLVRGPAGAGKSRLAEWLTVRASETGAATSLRARHAPIAGRAHGLPAMVGGHLKCEGLERGDLFDHLLGRLRGSSAAGEPSEPLHEAVSLASFVRSELQSRPERAHTLAAFLARVAAARPAIVWLDDVQWGLDTLELTDDVLSSREARALPVLFVLTAQDEALAEHPEIETALSALCSRWDAARIDVAMLEESDRHELVTSLLGLDERLVEAVAERTAGNPLFAVQLVGDWVQRGVLEIGPRGFRLKEGDQAPLPNDIHGSWTDRLRSMIGEDGTPEADAAWRALEIAAALGGEVDTREWEVACDLASVPPPRRWIEPLLARRLAIGAPSAWSFVHGMLRESLERVSRERGRWARFHRACAEMIGRLHDPEARGVQERIGAHLIAAGELADAVEPLLRAAAQRVVTADFEQATALLDERDRILDELGAAEGDARRLAGWTERTRALARLGLTNEAIALAERVEALARTNPHGGMLYGEITRLRAFLAHKAGDTARAVELYGLAIDRLRQAGSGSATGRAYHGLAEVHALRGELDASESAYRTALALAEAEGDVQYRAHELSGLGNVVRQRGHIDEAEGMLDQSMQLYEQVGDRLGAAVCHNYLGEMARQRGDLALAEAHYRTCADTLGSMGSPDALVIRLNLCLVLILRDAIDRAESILLEVLPALDPAGLGGFATFAHVAMLVCTARRGDWESFDHHAARAEQMLAGSQMVDEDIAWPAERAAELAAARGEPEHAARAARIAESQRAALTQSAQRRAPDT